MDDIRADAVGRLLAGDLHADEQHHLAQAALDDPDLFDRITAAAAIAAVCGGAPTEGVFAAPERVGREGWSRRRIAWAITASAAAAALLFALVLRRSTPQFDAPLAATRPPVRSDLAEQPILLAARIDAAPSQQFRADATAGRLPKDSGVVVSVRDGVVNVDLGSLDGLREGMNVDVATGSSGRAGRVRIATVFRERARGRAVGAVKNGDRIVVAPAVHVGALLDEAAARASAGDADGARTILQQAVEAARAPVPADVRRTALERLGVLERLAGRLDDAARALSSAIEEFEAAPPASSAERVDALNELGAVQIQQGDYTAAERTLRAAEPEAVGVARVRVINNLGAAAALRGDRSGAAALYRLAQSAAGEEPALAADRAAIQTNLNALRSGR